MRSKCDSKRPATAEPSLLDIFGPNISDEVKANNLRAAALSMGDMVAVLNQATVNACQCREPIIYNGDEWDV